MKIKISIITASLIFLSALTLSAQGSWAVKEKLASADGQGGARIEVTEAGDAGSIVKMLESTRKNTAVSGYRVRILFDNSQTARANAANTRARFEEMFPNIPTHLKFESPYFKVSVGNCLTIDEATILWGRIKGSFDKAFPMREEILLSELMKEANRRTVETEVNEEE